MRDLIKDAPLIERKREKVREVKRERAIRKEEQLKEASRRRLSQHLQKI